MIQKIGLFIRRQFRLMRGRCPYCNAKMLNGMGGTSVMFLNGLTVCPNKHYAKELHYTGATLIYDAGGKPLNIEGLPGDEEKVNESSKNSSPD